MPEPQINMGYEQSFSTKPKNSYHKDYSMNMSRRDISNDNNPFGKSINKNINSSYSPIRGNNEELEWQPKTAR